MPAAISGSCVGSDGSVGVTIFATRWALLGIDPTSWPQFRLNVSMVTSLPRVLERRDDALDLGAFEQPKQPEHLVGRGRLARDW